MTQDRSLNRRRFMLNGLALGCSAAASPFLTPMTFAATPWDERLIVIILRGGMDGLDVVQPYGAPALAGLRKNMGFGEAVGASDLDGFFSLHPAMAPLMPLWGAGELAFAHAVSTPYRDKRSHFDGQDMLEAGSGFGAGEQIARDGWLNRMLQTIPGIEAETAFVVGRDDMLILTGDAPVSNWAPGTKFSLSPQFQRLLEVSYEQDPLFRAAVLEAIDLTESLSEETDASSTMEQGSGGKKTSKSHLKVAKFAAERLRGKARVASFSINGWDTHRNQRHGLKRALTQLSETILQLRESLGPVWGKTAVLAMTEFGRTARENGTFGTDHGTGGAMLMAGGAVRGKKVYSDWPGLEESDLYNRRDLMPTQDVRLYAASAMQGLLGIDTGILETAVFPGLDMGPAQKVIL